MLQAFREKTKNFIAVFVLGLVIIMFLVWGKSSFFASRLEGNAVIKVGSRTLDQADFNKFYEAWTSQLPISNLNSSDRLQQKKNLAVGMARTYQSIEGLKSLGFQVNPEWVNHFIKTQSLFQEKGQFSPEKYKQHLIQTGFNEKLLQAEAGDFLIQNYFRDTLVSTSFYLKPELELHAKLDAELRKIGYLVISSPKTNQSEEVQISENEIQHYYAAHQADFILPEKISLSYLELDRSSIEKDIDPTESELENFFNKNQQKYDSPAQVRARHILFEKTAEGKKQAEQVLSLLKSGHDFAKLATEHSLDNYSKTQGGDLGWFDQTSMVPEFSEAAFKLNQPNELSPLVETKFGYHIIQLIDKKTPNKLLFTPDVKPMVAQHYKTERAAHLFNEQLEKIKNLTYEHPETLKIAAETLGLTIKNTDFFSKNAPLPMATKDPILYPQVIKKAFEKEVYEEQQNSSLIALSPTHYVVFRVHAKEPQKQQELAAVTPEITAKIKTEKLRDLVKKKGTALLETLRMAQPEKVHEVLQKEGLSWQEASLMRFSSVNNQPGVSPEIVHAAFHMKPLKNAWSWSGFELKSGDYAVLALSEVQPGTLESLKSELLRNPAGENYEQMYQEMIKTTSIRHDMLAITSALHDKLPEVHIKESLIENF